jgi:tryptophanyl-tRNA synthetase
MHALTTHPKADHFKESVRNVLVEYLAAGIDPEVATIYIQSDVPQIPELYLLMNMYAYVGELERCTSFKDKIRKHSENVNAGLLTYPVLMAADIIIHKATKVPVGKDQEQHLEMARNFVNRFNHLYEKDVLHILNTIFQFLHQHNHNNFQQYGQIFPISKLFLLIHLQSFLQ